MDRACYDPVSSIDRSPFRASDHARESAHDTTLLAQCCTVSSAREEAEVLRAEVRRLRVSVRRLEEEKRDLEERLAFLAMELERTRAMVTGQIRTS